MKIVYPKCQEPISARARRGFMNTPEIPITRSRVKTKRLHNRNFLACQKEVNDAGFLLTNRMGGYLSFSNNPVSRYNGLFFMDNFRMYKTVENISLNKPFDEIKNNLWNVERKRGDVVESFFMPFFLNSLVYELGKEQELELYLDFKESYDNAEFGRHYEVGIEKGKIIVRYVKKGKKEDEDEYSLFLAIKPDNLKYEKKGEWVNKFYELDNRRKSPPASRFVYNALKLTSKKIVFSMSREKEKAMKEADFVFKNLAKLKSKQKNLIKKNKRVKNKEINTAYNCAINALRSLMFSDSVDGVLAGLPWFFQFWTRDELICSKALCLIGQNDFAKQLLIAQLNGITFDGRMFDKYPAGGMKNADLVGWLFKRLSEIKLSEKEHELVKKKLEFCIHGINKNYTENGLVKNNALETWMDTEYKGDSRAGFRIEIQAMQLFLYKFMYKLSKPQKLQAISGVSGIAKSNSSIDEKYKKKEERLKKKVRSRFWNGKFLADGLDDFTMRPNIFIAAYFYPELLTRGEWKRCFERIIPKLWLDWGGFSTIEKDNPLFTDEYSGEDNRSYHRGDSWFWLNNLAAIVMNKIDKKKFKVYINKILEASTEEILFKGAVGCAAELSSAKELRSEGCFIQAWSNATYIELVNDLF